MEPGKIYFISFGGTEIIGRFKDAEVGKYNFYAYLHYWAGFESFRTITYCVTHGITEIRRATQAEKHALLKFEIEHETI